METITKGIKEELAKCEFNSKKFLNWASDGASVMVGMVCMVGNCGV